MKTFKEFISEARRIGKVIGGEQYVHKNYESAIPDQEGLERAKAALSPEHRERYNVVKHNKKEGSFTFFHSPDFDESDYPISGEAHKVSPEGKVTITKQKKDPQIWHGKHYWVGDDYKGFDVEKSKEDEEKYKATIAKLAAKNNVPTRYYSSRIGTKSFWEREVLPHIGKG